MKNNWRRILAVPKWIIIVAVVLIAIRAVLPVGVKWYINKTLDEIPGYYGRIADVDLAIWRGAYKVQGIKLVKINGNEQEPFFAANEIDISLDWRALFDGRVVTKISLMSPKLQFIQRATKEASQTSIDQSWQDKVQKLYPFEINRFAIYNGLLRYKDQTSSPKINLYMDHLDLSATNISNTKGVEKALPSGLIANGELLESGKFDLKSKVNFFAEPFEADLNAAVRGLDLKEINDFAKAYGDFDFEKGNLDVTLELAASKKRYDGYVKTLAKNIDLVDWSKERKEGDSVGQLLWEGLAGTIMELFENQRRDQFAARIPIAGSRSEMKIDTWSTLGSVLRNAFVQALNPKLEQSVEFSDAVRGPASEDEKKDEKKKEEEKKEPGAVTDRKG